MKKLDLASPDFVAANIEKLAGLFPHCVTEGADGKAIDFDLLKQELSHQIVDGNKERYRLEWPGKREAIVTANLPTTQTLRPIRADSVDFDNTENLYIEGDNLEVLKLLQESYLNKVKVIYIDPPYNTGNDFVYKDNFAQDRDEYQQQSGQKDEYQQRLSANLETAGRYHSNWLSMMYPRLKLARNLLTDDGVIFISIDDHEVHNLRKLCDEIFGEVNFVGDIIRKTRTSSNHSKNGFNTQHENTLIFAKSNNSFIFRGEKKDFVNYKNPDNDPNGDWVSGDPTANLDNRSQINNFEIKNPYTQKIDTPSQGRRWRFSKDMLQKLIKEGKIIFKKKHGDNERGFILKRYKKDIREMFHTLNSLNMATNDYLNQRGTQEKLKLFGKDIFDYPKPNDFLKKIMHSASDKNDIILDFFAGSSTSAHAVMQLNAEDGGKRKFIQVQIPDIVDEKSEAFKAGYNNICEIGKERIRRAAKNIKHETSANIDDGFRVYRLDSSNMEDVYHNPRDYDQNNLDMFADNVKADRTADDLLAQVMLDWGLSLALKITPVTIGGKQVFKVDSNVLYACFDEGIDQDFAKAIAKESPRRLVFKDSSFKDDTAKVNVAQLLKQLSPETKIKVI